MHARVYECRNEYFFLTGGFPVCASARPRTSVHQGRRISSSRRYDNNAITTMCTHTITQPATDCRRTSPPLFYRQAAHVLLLLLSHRSLLLFRSSNVAVSRYGLFFFFFLTRYEHNTNKYVCARAHTLTLFRKETAVVTHVESLVCI